jgi:hypothetical protein
MPRAENLTTFMCRFSRSSGSLDLLDPYGHTQACNGIASPFFIIITRIVINKMFLTCIFKTKRIYKSIISEYAKFFKVKKESPSSKIYDTAALNPPVLRSPVQRSLCLYQQSIWFGHSFVPQNTVLELKEC